MDNDKISQMIKRENLTLASYRSRILAFIIDEFLISFIFIIIIWDKVANLLTQEHILEFINANVWQVIVLKVIYHAFFVALYGATLGKMLAKIKVISVDLIDNPSWSLSILRSVIRILSESVFYLGFAWAFFDKNRQSWQDKLAKTLVVNV